MKRFAVVLGASGEIGQSICRQLAEDGWSLYLHWNRNGISELTQQLADEFPRQEFIALQSDLSQSGSAKLVADQVYDASCIVVASGQSIVKLLTETTSEDMDALWHVHVKNPVEAIRFISPFFHRHPKSYVVFVTSIWGETGASMETVYSAVKGAQSAFVKAYAKEMAPAGTRVNAVSPGFIQTKMNHFLSEEELEELQQEIPLGFGEPKDIADAVSFLVNGKADYMTGQILRINGGWHM
ncbi:elongation factor P 5-aminopentanone reductase [Planococcus salinus]|uniref:SDR family oxidoreductase n=1 Tax=Planococcus salinus TaxID=1848460 RepID=A0A3M8PA71_9BACL|nr:SDR family oxidoreductase [Planococcus salinus]RNF40577.1 SDR family oxidoreductase [Planococcus salinus]